MSGPSAGRLFCFGDVHGCVDELRRLLEDIAPEPRDRLVFLGDYVDRGPDAAGTIDLLLEVLAKMPETVFLRGNHEAMLLGFLGGSGEQGEMFMRSGGAATLQSYGVDPEGALAGSLRERMPQAHVDFLRDHLSLWHASTPWVFVHAGVRPGTPLPDQHVEDLLWSCEAFPSHGHGLDATVVFGHTPYRDVVLSPGRWIAMDTGCVYGGLLSALDLSQGVLHQVRRGAVAVTRRDVAESLDRTL